MRSPPLLLEKYFYPKIRVATDPTFMPVAGETCVECDVRVESEVLQDAEQPDHWQVTLRIQVRTEAGQSGPYEVDLDAVGFFRVDRRFPEDEVPVLVRVTGSSILYSAAREFLLGITARAPWGPLSLPPTSFRPGKPSEPGTKAKGTSGSGKPKPEPKRRRPRSSAKG